MLFQAHGHIGQARAGMALHDDGLDRIHHADCVTFQSALYAPVAPHRPDDSGQLPDAAHCLGVGRFIFGFQFH
jgi:hypothetical protein